MLFAPTRGVEKRSLPMSHVGRGFVVSSVIALGAVIACACGSGEPTPPAGSCHTGGTATGSSVAACNQCGQQRCDAELRDKAGSGYAQQYWGGDGACAAFNGCTCNCLVSTSDPLQCATTACFNQLSPACQAALQKAQDCMEQKCAAECGRL
jgi:hypothetical protein